MKVQPNRKVYIKRPERKIKALAIHASHSSLGEHLDAGVDPNEGEDDPDAIGNNHEGPDFRWSKALVPSVPDETEKIDKCPIHNLPVRGDADAAHHEGRGVPFQRRSIWPDQGDEGQEGCRDG